MSVPWSWPWSRHFPARVLLKHNPKWQVIVELNFRFPCHSVDGKHLTRFPSETTTAPWRSVEAAIMCYRAKKTCGTDKLFISFKPAILGLQWITWTYYVIHTRGNFYQPNGYLYKQAFPHSKSCWPCTSLRRSQPNRIQHRSWTW